MSQTSVFEQAAALLPLDRYRLVRSRIEHEDDLVTQRLNWLMASQSFLFTAYAITTNAPDSVRADRLHLLLMGMIPLMAICAAALVFLTVMAGLIAMRHLHAWLHAHLSALEAAGLPPVQGFANTRALGMSAPVLLPPIFLVVWVYLMLVGRG